MGGACSTYGIDDKCVRNYVVKPKGKRPPEELGADGG
jgi:hypothetical protein